MSDNRLLGHAYRHRTLDQLHARAVAELANNPTIVSYVYSDDGEKVGPVCWAGVIQRAMDETLEMICNAIGLPPIKFDLGDLE